MWHAGRLTDQQVAVVESHLPAPALVEDLSWNQVDTVVLHLATDDGDVIVKAAGAVKVIDFGRFALRPAASDLCRLAAQQWREDRALEAAFMLGYGTDPRDETLWPLLQLREAIGTAAWAYQVGAKEFEAQGHRMLDEALLAF